MEILDDSTKQREAAEIEDSGKWWVSWINTAKEKTSTVFEAVRKDLDELAVAVRTEASNVGATIENSLNLEEQPSSVGTVRKSISSFFDQVTKALIPPLEDDDAELVLITHNGTLTLTGFMKHLAELQSEDKTYLESPDQKLADNYKRWMEVVEQDQFTQGRLARHLMCSEILNDKYLTLVPDKVCHMEFWQRYLFKRALLEDALANAKLTENRAKLENDNENSVSLKKSIVQTEQPKLSKKNVDEITSVSEETNDKTIEEEFLNDEITWKNEEIVCNVELSEEEQIRLLEQYEQEIQERGGSNNNNISKEKKTNINKDKNIKKNELPLVNQSSIKSSDKKLNEKKNQSNNKTKISQENKKNMKNSNNTKSRINQQQTEKEKDENESSTASDESWEKDFDLHE